MPPQIAALLQDKKMLAIVGGVLVMVIMIMLFAFHPWAPDKVDEGAKPIEENQLGLATVDSIGKAIEIQALLAREGIHLDKEDGDGGKVILRLPKGSKQEEKDRALITLVQSGLMDRNIGLESFDKGDLTASREEKRIKLVRAQQGEISRLIRKIRPVEDAAVNLSIPEPTIFKSEMKPMSASIQVTIPNGERLDKAKVRSIINLIVGSIQGLDANHVSLSDTNGTVYNSVLDIGSELNDKIEEQDNYMKQKVSAQLDKLVGAGHYVVTVSTMLREAPRETMVQTFDPDKSAVSMKQGFTERLNANNGKSGLAGGPASSFVPSGVDVSASGSTSSNRGYVRNGSEVSYANGKTQWVETSVPGMIEDISIAVTVDNNYMPQIPTENFQQLLASAASPKVNPASVTIAQTDFQRPNLITSSGVKELEKEVEKDMSWIVWPIVSVIAVAVLLIMMALMRPKPAGMNPADAAQMQQNQLELQQLKEFTAQQMSALQASQQQSQMLMEQQQRQLAVAQQSEITATQIASANQLRQTLNELKEAVNEEDLEEEDLEMQIKTWIEST